MNPNFYTLSNLFEERKNKLNSFTAKRLHDGDFTPRSKEILRDINEAQLDNVQTDQIMMRRFTTRKICPNGRKCTSCRA